MSLKLALKPHERIIIGGAVIKNGASSCHLLIENNVPILRQADILSEADANSPCRRIYFVIQLLYIEGEKKPELQPLYWELVSDVLGAAPSMKDLISQISQLIIKNKFYQALKIAKKLIQYEEELLKNVTQSS
ncbi:MAG: flagellar biosynthesis repressor FlbT [Desulfuromonadales bacterium]|nr:flagellar biosynthesis repressor FlbT [Desulfuromonadales bacterium]